MDWNIETEKHLQVHNVYETKQSFSVIQFLDQVWLLVVVASRVTISQYCCVVEIKYI